MLYSLFVYIPIRYIVSQSIINKKILLQIINDNNKVFKNKKSKINVYIQSMVQTFILKLILLVFGIYDYTHRFIILVFFFLNKTKIPIKHTFINIFLRKYQKIGVENSTI